MGKWLWSEALTKVIDYLLNEVGFELIEAKHLLDNPASGRVMEKSGMKYEATFLVRGIRNGMDYEYEENLAAINEEISGLDTLYIRAGKLGHISSSMVMELLENGKNVKKYLPQEVYELVKG